MSPPGNAKRIRHRVRFPSVRVAVEHRHERSRLDEFAAVNRDDPSDGIDGATWPWHPTTLPVPSRYLPLHEVLGEIERSKAVNAWAFGYKRPGRVKR